VRYALLELGVLVMWDFVVFAAVQLFPVEGGLFFTDLPATDGIMCIGVDSNGLASASTVAAAGLSGKIDILDVCTGSGVQGITAARHAIAQGLDVDLTLLDINPRARRFVTANLLLNGANGKFVESDVFAEVQSSTFDIILANTPFVPTSEWSGKHAFALYTDGGVDGEAITRRVIQEGLPLLRTTGRMLIATPIYNQNTILQRLRAWFTTWHDAGIIVLYSEPESYSHPANIITTVAREGIIGISRGNTDMKAIVVKRAWTAMAGCGSGPKWNNWMNCFHPESSELRVSVLRDLSEFIGGESFTTAPDTDEL